MTALFRLSETDAEVSRETRVCSWKDCTTVLPVGRKHRYCALHQAEYMREWRKTHSVSETEKKHQATRSKTNMLVRRGHLTKQPCRECGEKKVEGHHPDYDDPRTVIWLCRKHHLELHADLRASENPGTQGGSR